MRSKRCRAVPELPELRQRWKPRSPLALVQCQPRPHEARYAAAHLDPRTQHAERRLRALVAGDSDGLGFRRGLAANSIFELTATSARDGSGLEALRWVRRDVVWAQDRVAFETATGIALGAAEQYRQVWWSWHGSETRESATATWTSQGELAVHSLNAQQADTLERQEAQADRAPASPSMSKRTFPSCRGMR